MTRALHNLYLVTLAIAFVATAVSFPAGHDWLAAGIATAVLGGADLCTRRWRGGIGYFLATAAAVGVLTAAFPTFASAAFGLLPMAFVLLPRWGAVVAGVVATGSPYLIQPLLRALPAGVGWRPEATIRFGPAYFVVVGVALPVLTGLFTAAAIRALNQQRQQLAATRAELATASRLAGQAEERQRLAHELHDTLAQGLAGVVLQLEAAEQHLHDGAAARLVIRARETAGTCLVDTRRAVAALRPEPLDGAPLVDAVRHVCERAAADLIVHGTARPARPAVEVVALRVVQEALANAGKHSSAVEVRVAVEYLDTGLRVSVHDNGCGFDPAHASAGFGLATMRERVAAVGGTLSVTSAPGGGTTVSATLEDL